MGHSRKNKARQPQRGEFAFGGASWKQSKRRRQPPRALEIRPGRWREKQPNLSE